MIENPKCPNCGQPMTLEHEPSRPNEQHAFQCQSCHLVFLTEDHLPISGLPLRR